MAKAKIYLVGDTEKVLVPMEETPYEAEAVLQELLQNYPDLIPGDQISPDVPRKWLLVRREAGIPCEDGGCDTWSLDHLFIDQDAVPTFVECKRACDTRIRREVVAQMLDYAANGTTYWPVDKLRQDATATARPAGQDINTLLSELLGDSEAEAHEMFWQAAEKNLKDGRIRLVFVADEIPRELQRLIEFMNEKMSDVEVVGVEVKQYLGENRRVVVPRLIGLTEKARQTRVGLSPSRTNQANFMANLPPGSRRFFSRVFELAEQRHVAVEWGSKGFSLRIRFVPGDKLASFAYGWPDGHFNVYFAYLDVTDTRLVTLRSDLMNLGLFRQSGQYTLDVLVDDANTDRLLEMYGSLLDRITLPASSN